MIFANGTCSSFPFPVSEGLGHQRRLGTAPAGARGVGLCFLSRSGLFPQVLPRLLPPPPRPGCRPPAAARPGVGAARGWRRGEPPAAALPSPCLGKCCSLGDGSCFPRPPLPWAKSCCLFTHPAQAWPFLNPASSCPSQTVQRGFQGNGKLEQESACRVRGTARYLPPLRKQVYSRPSVRPSVCLSHTFALCLPPQRACLTAFVHR